MRRITLAIVLAGAALMTIPVPAFAKGEQHARVTITGPGLAAPIHLRGGEAVTFIQGTGAGETKWDAPNIGGNLTPDAKLGQAFVARIVLSCTDHERTLYRLTLYPYARNGLQAYTPPGARGCFGMNVEPGYWPASDAALALLTANGLPRASALAQDAGKVTRTSTPSSGGRGWGILLALGAAVTLVGLGAVGALRRRRRAVA